MKPVPEIGKEYYFFDDGKNSPSRCYKAKVLRIVPYKEEVLVDEYDYNTDQLIPTPIQEVHKGEVKACDWLYAKETDYFIECSIPGYDEHNIWFARTKNGGWFSMDIQSSWQSGRLDIDNSQYQSIKEYTDEEYWYGWYDQQLREKEELIENG